MPSRSLVTLSCRARRTSVIVSRIASGGSVSPGRRSVSTTISRREITTFESFRGGLNRSASRRKNRRLGRGTATVSERTRLGGGSVSEGGGSTGARVSGSRGRSVSVRGSESGERRPPAGRESVSGRARLSRDPSMSARMFFSSRLDVAPARIDRRRLIVRRSLSASSRTMLSRRIVCNESPLPAMLRSESMRARTVRSSRR